MPNEDVVALLGGLGNQLFQVAFGQWLETRTGRELAYDVSFHRAGEPDVLRIPGIGDDVSARLLRGTRRWPTADGRVAPLGRAIRRLRGPRRIVSDYSGPGPEHPAIDAAAWWFGYWQRLEYAQPMVGRLAEALELEDARKPEGLVGVHVRRTDMLTRGTVVPEEWFAEALARLEPRLLAARVRVWSDDPEWCRAELDLGGAVRGRRLTGRRYGTCGKWLSCRVLLISRSTFSWWAANLAANRGARVAYPAPWWPGTPALDRTRFPQSGCQSRWAPAPRSDPLPYEPRMRITALLASHNRRPKTLACLSSYFAQEVPDDVTLSAVLVDDGSTDGTADAVRERFPAPR